MSILGPKWFICPKQKTFLKKIINIIVIYLLAPFIPQNLKKNILSQSTVVTMCHFRVQNTLICPENFFLFINGPNHYYYFHLPIGPFHWAKFKKYSYSESRVMKMHHFWAQNGPFAPNKIFFWKKSLISC